MKELFQKMFKLSNTELYRVLEERLQNGRKTFIVTANPETFMNLCQIPQLYNRMFDDNTMMTPDGEGIVYAARKLNYKLWGKIAGVETVQKLLELGDRFGSKAYFFGAKQEVLDRLANKLRVQYPHLEIVGLQNGYVENREPIFEDMQQKTPDLIFVALGVPCQEEEIAKHIDSFQKGIFIGCGGSLDVLSGTKCRAPQWLINLKLEWLYRLAKEPSRIKRFWQNNVMFLLRVRKEKRRLS
jgi:bacterial polymer biosynthesis proteins, WecB/TagA/CpsF family